MAATGVQWGAVSGGSPDRRRSAAARGRRVCADGRPALGREARRPDISGGPPASDAQGDGQENLPLRTESRFKLPGA